ncbi:MAG: hypothetical protein ACFFAN_00730 [Promethearchaeota archaeon]
MPERYFCSKCKRKHYRGKIYENHLKYRKKNNKVINPNKKKKNFIPSNEIIEFDFNELRPIAWRQIRRLVMKMHQTKNFKLYTKEINKILLHEKKLLM